MVAIMGPSGSGKSTLMHVLGLLHAPDAEGGAGARAAVRGAVDDRTCPDRERTRIRATEMGFVFQSFNLIPTLSAIENIMLAADYAGTDRSTSRSPRPSRPSTWSAWPTGRTTARQSSRVASSSGSRSRGR